MSRRVRAHRQVGDMRVGRRRAAPTGQPVYGPAGLGRECGGRPGTVRGVSKLDPVDSAAGIPGLMASAFFFELGMPMSSREVRTT